MKQFYPYERHLDGKKSKQNGTICEAQMNFKNYQK